MVSADVASAHEDALGLGDDLALNQGIRGAPPVVAADVDVGHDPRRVRGKEFNVKLRDVAETFVESGQSLPVPPR